MRPERPTVVLFRRMYWSGPKQHQTAHPSKWTHLRSAVGPLQWGESPAQTNTSFGPNFPCRAVPVCSALLKQPASPCLNGRFCVVHLNTPSQSSPFRATLGAVLPWLCDQSQCLPSCLIFPVAPLKNESRTMQISSFQLKRTILHKCHSTPSTLVKTQPILHGQTQYRV